MERSRHLRDQRTKIYANQLEQMMRIADSLSVIALEGLDRPTSPPLLPDLQEYMDAELRAESGLRLFCSDEVWLLVKRYQSAIVELIVSVQALDGVRLSSRDLDTELREKVEGLLDDVEVGLRIVATQMRADLGTSELSREWEKALRHRERQSGEAPEPPPPGKAPRPHQA
jgi:hypothetical protein